jgi:hypothetical protein
MAVTIKNAIFLDVASCGFIINGRFGGTCRLHHQDIRNRAREEKCWTVTNKLITESKNKYGFQGVGGG